MSERYFSIDIETSGPIVGRHSLLSIGACRCDDTSRRFSRDVVPISDDVDENAMQIVGKPLQYFRENGADCKMVFAALRDWVIGESDGSSPVFVGFNAAFDWGFVNWYFLTTIGENPFGIAPLDIKSYYAGFGATTWDETRSSRIPMEFKSASPHTHNALDDAAEQAGMFNKLRAAATEAMRPEERASPTGRLKNLRRVANQQASLHAILRDRYRTANQFLAFGSLIPTATLLCLAFVSDEYAKSVFHLESNEFKLVNGGVALFAFVCILIQLQWKPDSLSDAHGLAVEHYAGAKYDVNKLLESSNPDPAETRFVEERYLDTRALPSIPDKQFVRLKQRHLRKVDLSRRLDKDPWMRIPFLWWEKPPRDGSP